MKNIYNFRLSIIAALLAFHSQSVLAAEKNGVVCPVGYTATFTNSNKTLTCSKQVAAPSSCTVKSICPPINNLTHIIMVSTTGIDKCAPVGAGNRVDSGFLPPLGCPSHLQYTRTVVANGQDIFKPRPGTQYSFPTGNIYIGNNAKGVTCPSGYTGVKISNNRGLRCEKVEPKLRADCDTFESSRIDWRGKEDRCLILFENKGTKPQGYPRIIIALENLMKDRKWMLFIQSAQDRWQRTFYRYPDAKL